MDEHNFQFVQIRDVDQAIVDWFDKTVNARVQFPDGNLKKVPVVFSQGERWAAGRSGFRDENGILILPVIAIRRTNISPDPSMSALGVQVDKLQISKQVNPKTNELMNLEKLKSISNQLPYDPIVYDVWTIPFPDRIISTYELVIQTQYIGQMNTVLQNFWRMLDIQKQFVAPLQNDGRHPPISGQFEDAKPLCSPYVVGFLDNDYNDSGNFDEFTDTERIVKYTTQIKVPAVLMTPHDGEVSPFKVERTAYKVVIPDENVRFVENQAELDEIFGPDW
jgi:hypothetical protein